MEKLLFGQSAEAGPFVERLVAGATNLGAAEKLLSTVLDSAHPGELRTMRTRSCQPAEPLPSRTCGELTQYVPNSDEIEVPRDGQEQKPGEDVHVEDSDCLPTTCPLVEPPSLLMRLFESSHFSPAIAMKYLYSCTEKGAKQYLGKKLFSFHHSRVDFFIPQLINLYINDKEVASAIHNYIEERCKGSLHFALICVWLLESSGVDRLRIKDRDLAHGDILRRMILNEFKPPRPVCSLKKWTSINRPGCLANGSLLNPENLSSGLQLTRSESATTSLRILSPATLSGGDESMSLQFSPSFWGNGSNRYDLYFNLSLNSDCHCFENEDAVECTCEAHAAQRAISSDKNKTRLLCPLTAA